MNTIVLRFSLSLCTILFFPRRRFWDPGQPGLWSPDFPRVPIGQYQDWLKSATAENLEPCFHWDSQWKVRTPESEHTRVPEMPHGFYILRMKVFRFSKEKGSNKMTRTSRMDAGRGRTNNYT